MENPLKAHCLAAAACPWLHRSDDPLHEGTQELLEILFSPIGFAFVECFLCGCKQPIVCALIGHSFLIYPPIRHVLGLFPAAHGTMLVCSWRGLCRNFLRADLFSG